MKRSPASVLFAVRHTPGPKWVAGTAPNAQPGSGSRVNATGRGADCRRTARDGGSGARGTKGPGPQQSACQGPGLMAFR